MKSNILVLCLIAAIASLLGIGISVKINKDPLLARILDQQQETLAVIQSLQRQGRTAAPAANVDRVKMLEDRIADLENKMAALNGLLQRAQQPAPQQFAPPPEDTTVHEIPIGQSQVKGPAGAPVTIVGFLDLQCPFSARFQPVIDQVLAAYPKQVKYVVKNFPLGFHQQAKPAAKAALAAAEQGKYWEMMELILKDNSNLSPEKLKEFATTIKLNMTKFDADLKSKDAQWEKLLQSDMELGSKVNVEGTPTYFINGRKMMGPQFEVLKQKIDEILKQK